MEEKKCCCGPCACLWLSGFFAMPAVVHIIRVIAGWQLIVAERSFTIKESGIVIVVTAILAIMFGFIGCKLMHKKEAQSCCQ